MYRGIVYRMQQEPSDRVEIIPYHAHNDVLPIVNRYLPLYDETC
jgi:hypothetical protein